MLYDNILQYVSWVSLLSHRHSFELNRVPHTQAPPRAKSCVLSSYSMCSNDLEGEEGELTRGCALGPPARLQRVDKSCHQQRRRI